MFLIELSKWSTIRPRDPPHARGMTFENRHAARRRVESLLGADAHKRACALFRAVALDPAANAFGQPRWFQGYGAGARPIVPWTVAIVAASQDFVAWVVMSKLYRVNTVRYW